MRIGKTGGTVATLALISVFVFGGVEVAHADAPLTLAPFGSTGATNPSLQLHGTATPDAPITVTATSTEATDAPYCQTTADGGGTWYCTKDTPGVGQLQFGSTVFTVTDGTSTPVVSAAITIYGTGGPSLIKPTSGSSVLPNPVFFGYGPARGSISVYADTGGAALCTVGTVPDSGEWNCASTTALPEGVNGFTVIGSTPGYPSDTFYSSTSNPVPVTVSQLIAPAVSYAMGYATATSTATTSFDNAAVYTELYPVTEGGGDYQSPSNPQLSCAPTDASDAAGPRVCAFGDLAAGIWKASSYQYLGEQSSPRQNDFFRIPEAPTMTADVPADETVAFTGTGTTGDLVSVIAEDGTTLCSDTVAAGTWTCSTTAAAGDHSYRAFQLDQGWKPQTDDSGHVDGDSLGTVLNGRSALTAPVTVTVPVPSAPPAAPTMSYVMGYATGSSTATGPEGALIHTELYRVTEPEGEGNGYSFDYPVVSCYPDSEATTESVGSLTTAEVQPAEVQPAAAQSAVQSCDFGELTPGIWNVYSGQDVDSLSSPFQNDFFRIPEAPTMVASGHADQTASFSGTGTTGDLVSVIADDGSTVCSATVVSGAWDCAAATAAGSHSYRAFQLDQGWAPYTDEGGEVGGDPLGTVLSGRSALTAPATVTVPAPSTPGTPSVVQRILDWLLTITGMDGPLHPGDTVTLSSSGLPAGSIVHLFLHSTPVSLGSVSVAQDGTFSKTVTIPEDVEPGEHHFVATVTVPGGAPSTVESPVTIVEPEELPTLSIPPSPTDTAVGGSQGKTVHGHGAAEPRNDPAAASSFTNSLPTLATLFENPGVLAVAVGLALAIMLLAALPTEILDSAVSSNLDRFGPFLSRAGSVAERATAWLNRVTRGSAASSAVMILLSSIIFGFADPGYGFNLVSLRLTISIVLALFVVYYIAPKISGAIIRGRWGVESDVSIQPTALVFAIVGVVIGRLLGFSPGFLIGLAIGLELASSAGVRHRVRSMTVQVGVIVGLSLLAWVGYSIIALALGGEEGSVWTGLVQDALATVTAEGLTGMLLGLFPITFFEGKDVWDYSKRLWAALFLVTGTAFALLVLPTAVAPQAIGESLPVWLLVLGCFTVLSLALWLYLKLTSKPESESAEEAREQIDA